jgi:copper chaperone NosL
MDLLYRKKKKIMRRIFSLLLFFSSFFISCSTGPQPVDYGKDACYFCKMNIVDPKFAAQCHNTKGKAFYFDDIHCVVSFLQQGELKGTDLGEVYFSDFNEKDKWIKSSAAFLLQSDALRSPMGSNTVAFSSEQARTEAMNQFNGTKLLWADLNPFNKK